MTVKQIAQDAWVMSHPLWETGEKVYVTYINGELKARLANGMPVCLRSLHGLTTHFELLKAKHTHS